MIYPNLLLGFLRVGCFSFGGAYGAIPLIRDIVLSYGWLSDEELTYMIAVSESTPGPIMVNLATYIGSSQAGLSGAVLATLAVVLPSFLVILLITAVLKTLLKNRYLQAALGAVKPCMAGIILATGLYMTLGNCCSLSGAAAVHWRDVLITVLLAAVLIMGKSLLPRPVSPVKLILAAAFLGMAIYALSFPLNESALRS